MMASGKIDKDIHERRVRVLMKINRELADEIERLNRIIHILTGPPSVPGEAIDLLDQQSRTRTLEKIYLAVAEVKDGEVN